MSHVLGSNKSVPLRPSAQSRVNGINKLIFNVEQSDDSSSEQSHNNTHSSMSKLQRLKSIKVEGSARMMPSLMAASSREDEGYVFEKEKDKDKDKKDDTRKKFKVRHSETMTSFKLFNFDDDETLENTKNQQQKMQQQVIEQKESQLPILQSKSIYINPEQKTSEEKKPRRSFFDNPVHKQQRLKSQLIQQSANPQPYKATHGQQQLVFQVDEQQLSSPSQPQQEHENTDMTTCGQEKSVQLIDTDAHSMQLCAELSTKLSQFQDPHNMRIFLTTPIPHSVYFNFEVHKYKNFMQTQYLLWLEHDQEMKLFAGALNNTLQLDKSVFTLSIKVTDKSIARNASEKDTFLGQLVSDFRREIYTLYDHKNYQKPTEADQVLCTVATVPNYINPKNKCQQLYIPRVTNRKAAVIHNNALSKNLKKLHKISKFYRDVEKLSTHGVPSKVIDRLREQFKIVTNTSRNAIVRDEQHGAKMLFLKMQQNRFKVRAGPGLTPLQVLSYATVHLQ